MTKNGVTKGWKWGTDDRVKNWGENYVAGITPGGIGKGDLLRFSGDIRRPLLYGLVVAALFLLRAPALRRAALRFQGARRARRADAVRTRQTAPTAPTVTTS